MAENLLKLVENTVGKGEIAHYEQFLLFPHCFQTACFPGESKGVIMWEWVNFLTFFPNKPLFSRVCSTSLVKTLLEKEKLLVTSNFSFSHCFLPIQRIFCHFHKKLKLSSANSFSLEVSKLCRLGKA